VDDDGDEQDLDEDEGDVAQEIYKDMVEIPEDEIMDEIGGGREKNHGNAETNLIRKLFHAPPH